MVRLERENKHLRTANLRLERESDDLAQELITSKIGLRSELDTAEEKADAYFKELQSLKRIYKEMEEDKIRIENEAAKVCGTRVILSGLAYICPCYSIKVKEMLQREIQKAEGESRRNQSIIGDYKKICSKLGRRLEEQQTRAKGIHQQLKGTLSDCPNCAALLDGLSALIDGSEQQSASPDQSVVTDTKSPPRSPTSGTSPFEMQVGVRRNPSISISKTSLVVVKLIV